MRKSGVLMILLILYSSFVSSVGAVDFAKPVRIAVLDACNKRLPSLGDFEILFIDGAWLEGQTEKQTPLLISGIRSAMLSGVPTMMLGGNIQLTDIVGDLLIKATVGKPLMAQAMKIYPGITVGDKLVSSQLLVSGVNVTKEEVVTRICNWAESKISSSCVSPRSGSSIASIDPEYHKTFAEGSVSSGSSSPSWGLWFSYTFLNLANPCGDLNITHCWYLLNDDGSNTYAWVNLITEITSTPGIATYGSDWRTAYMWNSIDADYFSDPNLLVDHEPPSTSGVDSIFYNIGVEAGKQGAMVTCKMPVSYSAQDVYVYNKSNPSEHLAKWEHDVPEQGNNGMNSYTIRPGATVRFLPIAPFSIHTSHRAEYRKPNWFWGWISPDIWTTDEISITTEVNIPRTINVIVAKASDSPSSFVNNMDDVKAGVLEAINDANTRTRVKISEQINIYEATSTNDLLGLVLNPPLRAVIINAHGETIPMPNQFFGPSIHITSPGDGQEVHSSPTVWAKVYPVSGSSLQLCQPEGYAQWSYVWVWWYRLGTGASNWVPMYPNASEGGIYSKSISLPAYDTYYIHVVAVANYLTTDAHITIYYESSGNGGCPYVSIWDGSKYVLDNNVLPGSEMSNGTDVKDSYLLQQAPVRDGGKYSFIISEFEQEHSYIDQVKLIAVDHDSDVNIAVTRDGEILTYENPVVPISCVDNYGNDRLSEISLIDGDVSDPTTYFYGKPSDYLILNFGQVDPNENAKLIMREDMIKKLECIEVQVIDKYGDWHTVATVLPRAYWSADAVNLSPYIAENQDLLVRLFWKEQHRLDFVGLDKTPQAKIKLKYGQLVSAIHDAGLKVLGSGSTVIKATYQNLLKSDNLYAELTPGYRIQMNFTFLEENKVEEDTYACAGKKKKVRDFILTIEGYYKKAGSPFACYANWQDWFDLLEDRTRNYGWIWANVAGYSCYYFGNTWYDSKIPTQYRETPGENGLKQFLSKDETCYYYNGHWARRGGAFLERTGFDPQIYNDIPSTDIAAWRPLPKTATIPWNTAGYVDTSTDDQVTVSIAMNASSLSNMLTGVFIHSGFAPAPNASDWPKGYIAAVLAVEEARAFIMTPKTLTQLIPTGYVDAHIHAATFSVTMLPGGWGESTVPQTFPDGIESTYRYVDLMLTISTHYEEYSRYIGEGYFTIYSLSEVDFKLDSNDTEVWAEIDLEHSGWETGNQTNEFNNDLGWWFIGLATDALGGCVGIPYLGSMYGLIPLLTGNPTPPSANIDLGRPVWANGSLIDPDENHWGTSSFNFRIIFRTNSFPRDYPLTLIMSSWIDFQIGAGYNPRAYNLAYSCKLEFTVTG
jgi:hypothetical protein